MWSSGWVCAPLLYVSIKTFILEVLQWCTSAVTEQHWTWLCSRSCVPSVHRSTGTHGVNYIYVKLLSKLFYMTLADGNCCDALLPFLIEGGMYINLFVCMFSQWLNIWRCNRCLKRLTTRLLWRWGQLAAAHELTWTELDWSELGMWFYITVSLKCVHVNANIAPKTRNGCESLLTICGVVGRFVKSRLCHQRSCLCNERTVRSSCSQVWRTLSLVCRDYPESWQQMPSLWHINKTQPRWYNPTPDALQRHIETQCCTN